MSLALTAPEGEGCSVRQAAGWVAYSPGEAPNWRGIRELLPKQWAWLRCLREEVCSDRGPSGSRRFPKPVKASCPARGHGCLEGASHCLAMRVFPLKVVWWAGGLAAESPPKVLQTIAALSETCAEVLAPLFQPYLLADSPRETNVATLNSCLSGKVGRCGFHMSTGTPWVSRLANELLMIPEASN